MYQERMFETWQKGLIHLVIVIAMPIIPVVIYMLTQLTRSSYLYILLMTVIISFIYEFMGFSNKKCSTFLKIENIICCVDLIIMFVWALFQLLLTYASENNVTRYINTVDFILLSLFGIPVIVTIIEIVRCMVFDIKSNKYPLAKNNLVGASKV